MSGSDDVSRKRRSAGFRAITESVALVACVTTMVVAINLIIALDHLDAGDTAEAASSGQVAIGLIAGLSGLLLIAILVALSVRVLRYRTRAADDGGLPAWGMFGRH